MARRVLSVNTAVAQPLEIDGRRVMSAIGKRSVDGPRRVGMLGLENDEEMIAETTGFDVILGGHNHIVLQPPKVVRDCSSNYEEDSKSFYIELNGAEPDT